MDSRKAVCSESLFFARRAGCRPSTARTVSLQTRARRRNPAAEARAIGNRVDGLGGPARRSQKIEVAYRNPPARPPKRERR